MLRAKGAFTLLATPGDLPFASHKMSLTDENASDTLATRGKFADVELAPQWFDLRRNPAFGRRKTPTGRNRPRERKVGFA